MFRCGLIKCTFKFSFKKFKLKYNYIISPNPFLPSKSSQITSPALKIVAFFICYLLSFP